MKAKSLYYQTTVVMAGRRTEEFIGHSLSRGVTLSVVTSTVLWCRLPVSLIILKALNETMHAILCAILYQ